MGQMLVRNLDDGVIESLKRQALERGTSLEQVAREALAAAAAADEHARRAAWMARADALRAQMPRSEVSSVDLIREARDERMMRVDPRYVPEGPVQDDWA